MFVVFPQSIQEMQRNFLQYVTVIHSLTPLRSEIVTSNIILIRCLEINMHRIPS